MNIEEARHRLEVLHAEQPTAYSQLTPVDRLALRSVLDELHRLHLAVSEQGRTLVKLLTAKKQPHQKPAAARSPLRVIPSPGKKAAPRSPSFASY
jgi:hypothetical protein